MEGGTELRENGKQGAILNGSMKDPELDRKTKKKIYIIPLYLSFTLSKITPRHLTTLTNSLTFSGPCQQKNQKIVSYRAV